MKYINLFDTYSDYKDYMDDGLMSYPTKLAPVKFISLLMGTWFLGTSIAGKLAGVYSGFIDKMTLTQFFTWPVITPIIASLILLVLIKPINRWMHGVK